MFNSTINNACINGWQPTQPAWNIRNTQHTLAKTTLPKCCWVSLFWNVFWRQLLGNLSIPKCQSAQFSLATFSRRQQTNQCTNCSSSCMHAVHWVNAIEIVLLARIGDAHRAHQICVYLYLLIWLQFVVVHSLHCCQMCAVCRVFFSALCLVSYALLVWWTVTRLVCEHAQNENSTQFTWNEFSAHSHCSVFLVGCVVLLLFVSSAKRQLLANDTEHWPLEQTIIKLYGWTGKLSLRDQFPMNRTDGFFFLNWMSVWMGKGRTKIGVIAWWMHVVNWLIERDAQHWRNKYIVIAGVR